MTAGLGTRETANEMGLRMFQTFGYGQTVSPGVPWIPDHLVIFSGRPGDPPTQTNRPPLGEC